MPELNSVVQQKIEVSPGLIIIRVSPIDWILPEFSAGQFTVLGLPFSARRYFYSDAEDTPKNENNEPESNKFIKRAYSIASSSKEKQYIEFFIRLVDSGELTPRVFALNVGDKIWMSPKITGMFTIKDLPIQSNIIFFGTGTGLAPYMSMLRSDLVCNENRKYAVIHGAKNSWDLAYRAELHTIERLCHNFSYISIISQPDSEPVKWSGLTGYLEKIWKEKIIHNLWGIDITPGNTHIFLCGHPGMIMSMNDILTSDSFREHTRKNPGTLHFEKYW